MKSANKLTPEWICNDCVRVFNLKRRTEIETYHTGKCDICNRKDVTVGPDRGYGYPIIDLSNHYEWDFPEPSIDVDLDKIGFQLERITLIEAKSYIQMLREKAPIVFSRFLNWCRANKKFMNIDELQKEKRG